MACRLFNAKPISEPMLPYCQLDPNVYISIKNIWYSEVFIQWNALENIVYEMAAMCPGGDELIIFCVLYCIISYYVVLCSMTLHTIHGTNLSLIQHTWIVYPYHLLFDIKLYCRNVNPNAIVPMRLCQGVAINAAMYQILLLWRHSETNFYCFAEYARTW